MTELQTKRLDRLQDAFRAYGYWIASEPIAGQEDLWLDCLTEGLTKLERHFAECAKFHCFRGKSKAAMSYLHKTMAEPTWGVELSRI